jgi:nucleoside-diphosphate-sugar epimerase
MSEAPIVDAAIVGCGDVGCRLALRLQARGERVLGLVRSTASAQALARLGIPARLVDLDDPASVTRVADLRARWLFHFAPPPETGSGDPRLRRLLAVLREPPQRLVYLSTSAVYGDCAGAWVDEDVVLAPQSQRGRRRLDAETAARDYAARTGSRVAILRVPGIYGPGRLPRARLAAGTPIVRREDAPFTNRIHADDLAEAARVVAERGAAGAAYNVCDGQPTTMSDYFIRAASLLGLPAPPEMSLDALRAGASPMLRSFLDESKRLRNERLRALGWAPQFASLAEGLPACLADDSVVTAFEAAA